MREIKFRGKGVGNSQWVYGYYRYNKDDDIHIIHRYDDSFPVEVDPTTVGQFTGLKDKNGKEIYEGDIIKIHEKGKNFPLNWVVVYNDTDASFKLRWVGRFNNDVAGFYDTEISDNNNNLLFEVIGNIHDNPELLNQHP